MPGAKPSTPRLADLDAETFGRQIVEAAAMEVTAIARELGLATRATTSMALKSAIVDLTRYAQRGGEHDRAEAAMAQVTRTMLGADPRLHRVAA